MLSTLVCKEPVALHSGVDSSALESWLCMVYCPTWRWATPCDQCERSSIAMKNTTSAHAYVMHNTCSMQTMRRRACYTVQYYIRVMMQLCRTYARRRKKAHAGELVALHCGVLQLAASCNPHDA
jgi:hypothetical protein